MLAYGLIQVEVALIKRELVDHVGTMPPLLIFVFAVAGMGEEKHFLVEAWRALFLFFLSL